MTRKDEFFELKKEYESLQPPAELLERMQASMEEAKAAAHRRKVISIVRNTAIATAAAAAIFVLPNSDSNVATAMGNMPLIGGLIKVVTVRNYEVKDEKTDVDVDVPKVEVAKEDTKEETEPVVSEDAVEVADNETSEETGKVDKEEKKVTEEIKESVEEVSDLSEKYINTLLAEYKKDAASNGYFGMHSENRVVTDNNDWFTLGMFIEISEADGTTIERYYHIDKNTGKVAKLSDVFVDGSDYTNVINRIINKKIASEPEKYFSKAEAMQYGDESYFKTVSDDTNFYFDVNGNLVIVFDECEIAPASTGIVRFTINAENVGDILKYNTARERQGSTSGGNDVSTGGAVTDSAADTNVSTSTSVEAEENVSTSSATTTTTTTTTTTSSSTNDDSDSKEKKEEEKIKVVVKDSEEDHCEIVEDDIEDSQEVFVVEEVVSDSVIEDSEML
nr:RsiV family protein [Lachnospiraceae bacterium]